MDEEHVLKSSKFDLNIIGPYNFSQSITSQILIPSTPPTIRYKDRVLRVHYKIRAQLFTEAKKTPNILLELPVVIGTWPRADVPIDDDDDDDIIQNMGELMISDAIDDDVWMRQQEELEFTRHSHSSFTLNNTPSPTSTISMKYSQSYYNTNNNNSNSATATANANAAAAAAALKRSGSNNSLGSVSSWRSQSTSDPRLSAATSPTSITGSVLSNNTIPDYQRNTLGLKMTNGYLNRSSSTPDLLSNPPPTPSPTLQQNQSNNTRARVIDPTIRSSYYEPQINNSSGLSHRSTKSLHSIHHPSHHQQQQHRRIGSDEFNVSPTSSSSFSVSPIPQNNEPDVPSHTLMFLSSSTTQQRRASPPRIITQQRKYIDSLDETFDSGSYLDDDDDDDDDDEDEDEDSDDDLFAIIEKKKRREEKEQKKRQRMMYTLTE